MSDRNPEILAILDSPYRYFTVRDQDSGTYTAGIDEFPGCYAEGDTREEAIENLKDVAYYWLEHVIENGQPVPQPLDQQTHSGKIALRIPPSTHRQITNIARAEGVSMNTIIASYIVAGVNQRLTCQEMLNRIEITVRSATNASGYWGDVHLDIARLREKAASN